MNSGHIDVSYFAAGIVAHLSSGPNEEWTVEIISKQEMVTDLVRNGAWIQT